MARYIDADRLKKCLIETLENLKRNPKMDGQEAHLISAFHVLGLMIDDAPTEDVKPVAHGKWVELYNYYDGNAYGCSVCGAEFIMIECTPQDNLWKFCPNCGADMRQEENNDEPR